MDEIDGADDLVGIADRDDVNWHYIKRVGESYLMTMCWINVKKDEVVLADIGDTSKMVCRACRRASAVRWTFVLVRQHNSRTQGG